MDQQNFLQAFENKKLLKGRLAHLLNSDSQESLSEKDRLELAQVYRRLGKLEAAKLEYQKLLEKDPNNVDANQYTSYMNQDKVRQRGNSGHFYPAPFYLVENYLPTAEMIMLEKQLEENQLLFQPSSIQIKDKNVLDLKQRKSNVLGQNHFKKFAAIFKSRITKDVHRAEHLFNLSFTSPWSSELYMTWHKGGDFFDIHSDVLYSGLGSKRKLTYVYYFNYEPKLYTGGELLLYDINSSRQYNPLNYTRIKPLRNSIIFFPSYCPHKVTTIESDSEKFRDGRFTVNGWFHD